MLDLATQGRIETGAMHVGEAADLLADFPSATVAKDWDSGELVLFLEDVPSEIRRLPGIEIPRFRVQGQAAELLAEYRAKEERWAEERQKETELLERRLQCECGRRMIRYEGGFRRCPACGGSPDG